MMNKSLTRVVISIAFLVGIFSIVPSHALAVDFNPLNPLDPFCLFSCDNSNTPQNVYNTTDSYNTNSFNTSNTTYGSNSPILQDTAVSSTGGAVYLPTNTPAYTAPTYNTTYNTTPVAYTGAIYATPSYNYNYPYNYNYTYNSPLYVSCYATPTNSSTGSTVTWSTSVSGGNGSYYYSWYGSDGLSGSGSSISRTYSYAGTKTATVTVTSDGQTVTKNCSPVSVYDYNYNYSYNYPYNYYNNYPYNYYYNTALSVSCSPSTTYSSLGSYVTWTAYPIGGYSGYGYTYSWSGTDGLYGSQQAISTYYNNPGVKYAYVTVYSNGQSASAQCSNTVTIGSTIGSYNYNSYNYNTAYPYSPVIQVACAADTTTARVGSPVTWNSEAYGSTGRFIYSWSGTDNLIGDKSSAITTYATPGVKNAIVTVTASNGQSQSKVCSNTVTVKSATAATAKKSTYTPPQTTAPSQVITQAPTAPAQTQQAPQVIYVPQPSPSNSIFSLQNVPWGWVAILVILVLVGIVFYLLFNKKQI